MTCLGDFSTSTFQELNKYMKQINENVYERFQVLSSWVCLVISEGHLPSLRFTKGRGWGKGLYVGSIFWKTEWQKKMGEVKQGRKEG